MNPKEALQKIKALFEDMPIEPKVEATPEVVVPEVTKIEMAEYSLADGTKVMISALEIGGAVTLEDGTPAPMGEHLLMDGTKIVVDELGIIVSIESPKEEVIEELLPEEVMPEVAPVEVPVAAGEVEDLKMKISELEQKISELENKAKQGFAQVAELIEALSNAPQAEPTQKSNVGFSSLVSTQDVKHERIEKFRNAILNNKK